MSAEVPASPCGGSHESGDQSPRHNFCDKDLLLPISNIGRIMRKSLTRSGKITKDAKDAMQECVTEFITFITSEVSESLQKEKRKTMNGDDILRAMAVLGFEDYINPLRLYLYKYRLIEGGDNKFLLGAEISCSSMEGDMMLLQQGSFIEGMGYMNTQGDAGGLQGGILPLPGSSMQGILQQGPFTGGMGYMNTQGDAGGLQGGILPGSSMQGGDAGGLQGGILPGSSMQGIPQQGPFAEGMGYMNTQVKAMKRE